MTPRNVYTTFLLHTRRVLRVISGNGIRFFRQSILPIMNVNRRLPRTLARTTMLFPYNSLAIRARLFPMFSVILFRRFRRHFLLCSSARMNVPRFNNHSVTIQLRRLLVTTIRLSTSFVSNGVSLRNLSTLTHHPTILSVPWAQEGIRFTARLFSLTVCYGATGRERVTIKTNTTFLRMGWSPGHTSRGGPSF